MPHSYVCCKPPKSFFKIMIIFNINYFSFSFLDLKNMKFLFNFILGTCTMVYSLLY